MKIESVFVPIVVLPCPCLILFGGPKHPKGDVSEATFDNGPDLRLVGMSICDDAGKVFVRGICQNIAVLLWFDGGRNQLLLVHVLDAQFNFIKQCGVFFPVCSPNNGHVDLLQDGLDFSDGFVAQRL